MVPTNENKHRLIEERKYKHSESSCHYVIVVCFVSLVVAVRFLVLPLCFSNWSNVLSGRGDFSWSLFLLCALVSIEIINHHFFIAHAITSLIVLLSHWHVQGM